MSNGSRQRRVSVASAPLTVRGDIFFIVRCTALNTPPAPKRPPLRTPGWTPPEIAAPGCQGIPYPAGPAGTPGECAPAVQHQSLLPAGGTRSFPLPGTPFPTSKSFPGRRATPGRAPVPGEKEIPKQKRAGITRPARFPAPSRTTAKSRPPPRQPEQSLLSQRRGQLFQPLLHRHLITLLLDRFHQFPQPTGRMRNFWNQFPIAVFRHFNKTVRHCQKNLLHHSRAEPAAHRQNGFETGAVHLLKECCALLSLPGFQCA